MTGQWKANDKYEMKHEEEELPFRFDLLRTFHAAIPETIFEVVGGG